MKLKCLVLIAFCSSRIFAQDQDTSYIWRQALGGAIIGRPTVQAQSIVMVLDGGNIKAYAASGRPLWNFSVPGRLSPYVTRSREGTSYICRTNGIFFAINRAGRELWRVNIGGTLSAPVVLGWDGRVFIPMAKKMCCYTASGNLLWTREFEDAINAGPCLDQAGGILLALGNGDVFRIDPYGASTVKRLTAPPRILLSVGRSVAAHNALTAPPIMALHRNGDVQLIDFSLPMPSSGDAGTALKAGASPSDAQVVNLPKLPSPPLAAASRGDTVAAILANGQLLMLSGSDGTILWTGDTHVRIRQQKGGGADNEASVIFDTRGVYALTANGATGFTADGRRLWYTTLSNASSIPAFDDDGVLYSGGKDWILYAWKLENRALRQKRSLYGPVPEGMYGLGPMPAALYYDDDQIQRQLDTIRRGILAGRVGEHESEWTGYLMGIAGGPLREGVFSFAHPVAHISCRMYALELLSRIGSNELVPWLVRLFKVEEEPLVKAAAARAIGGIGVDPNGMAMREFLSVANEKPPLPDEQVLAAVATAVGALCRFSGPPLSETGTRILISLGAASRPPLVQKQALLELKSISTEEQKK